MEDLHNLQYKKHFNSELNHDFMFHHLPLLHCLISNMLMCWAKHHAVIYILIDVQSKSITVEFLVPATYKAVQYITSS